MRKLIVISFLLLGVNALLAQENKFDYRLVNLEINTEGSDYGAILYQDSLVVFTSEQQKLGRRIKKSVNRTPFTDIYLASRTDSQVVNRRAFGANFMSVFHESDGTFTPDGRTAFFTANSLSGKKRARQDDSGAVNLQILITQQNDEGEWSEPIPLSFIQDTYSYAHPSVSEDGKRLFFSSNMPGSQGRSDIYFINIFPDGNYSAPINIGYNINTPDSENFPYVSGDGKLYFSSDRFGGMGGLDIYVSEPNQNGLFGIPRALEGPINSSADDFAFKFYEDESLGFFASNREGGKGSDDIYMFYKDCNLTLEGYVRSAITTDTVQNAMVYLYGPEQTLLDSLFIGSSAKYTFKTACQPTFELRGSKNLFQDSTRMVSTDTAIDNRLEMDLFLTPIINEKMEIMIGPIYFDFDEAIIRETIDGKEEMDRIVTLMNANPTMVVEVASYTDSRGEEDYNQRLSQARADSTVSYIIKAGIDSTRIYGTGYGETGLMNECTNGVDCTAEQHQLNRRTEFKVVSIEGKEFEQIVRTSEAYTKEEEEDQEEN